MESNERNRQPVSGCGRSRRAFVATALFATLLGSTVCALAQGGGGGQASLVLENAAATICHRNTTDWTVTKSVDATGTVESGTPVTFTINVTRGATSDNTLCVDGYVSIRNGGSNTAFIGNIVVNLQKRVGNKWVSAAADIATASPLDTDTAANIVASQSQELTNFINYVKGNPAGTFSTTSASGSLGFFDASNNSIFSISPTFNLGGGQTQNLLFQAEFNNSVMGLAPGTELRAEILVTFGGAGSRGGGNSSATNIDVNGDGLPESDVRTVPVRIGLTVPALQLCNNSITLTDLVSTTGTASLTDVANNLPGFPIFNSGTYTVTGTATATDENGGTITNTATITGASSSVVVNGPIDSLTGQPIYSYTFDCCIGVNKQAQASVSVVKPPKLEPGDYITYSQGGWGGGGAPATALTSNFSTVYPGGFVEVGIPGAAGFSIKLTGAGAVCKYLPAGGSAGKLTVDIASAVACSTGPSSPSSSSGQFGGQVLSLQLSVDFSAAGILGFPSGLGALTLGNFDTSGDALNVLGNTTALTAAQVLALNGQTIAQVLAEANTVLGGGASTYGLTVPQLSELVANLNLSFDGGTLTAWALAHLSE